MLEPHASMPHAGSVSRDRRAAISEATASSSLAMVKATSASSPPHSSHMAGARLNAHARPSAVTAEPIKGGPSPLPRSSVSEKTAKTLCTRVAACQASFLG